jgi:hypothetical protein
MTWFRFGAFLAWLVILPLILAQPLGNPLTIVGLLILSPALAIGFYLVKKAAFIVIYFVPVTNVIVAYLRIGFIFAFSRIIVQEAPEIAVPMWAGGGR